MDDYFPRKYLLLCPFPLLVYLQTFSTVTIGLMDKTGVGALLVTSEGKAGHVRPLI